MMNLDSDLHAGATRRARVLQAYSPKGAWARGEALPHHRHIVPAMMALLPRERGLRILDVGCGNGYVDNMLTGLGHRVTGIDFDAEVLAIARARYPHLDLRQHSAETRLRELCDRADVVVALEVIEHLYSPQKFLANVRECLRPGGSVILSMPYYGYLKNLAIGLLGQWDKQFVVHWEQGHIKFFSVHTAGRMLRECGFRDVVFHNAGRLPFLWKSIVVRAEKA